MTSVATTPQGLMAGGWLTHAQGEVGVVWTAPNASGWLAPGKLATDCCSSVRSVAAGDGRLRLLLPHTSADGSQLPPPDLLDSADGREWQTNQVPETFSPVKLVITGRHGAFAVGSGISGGNDSIAMLLRLSTVTNPSTPPQTPVPTSSTEPSSAWVATSIAEAGGIQAMVESGPTLSAFGWGDGAATWTSPDGTTWGPEAPIASPDEMDGVVVRTAVWLGPLYVVGGYGGVDQTVPLILTSTDRRHWDLAEIPGAPFCGRINDIVKHGSQLVALGVDCTSEPGRGLILTSHDGAAWTTVEVGFADLDGAELMGGVAVGDELIAVGDVHQPEGTTLGGVWGSAAAKGEGITSLGAGPVWSVTERDGLVVAVGESSANGTSSPAGWTSRGAGFGEWTQVELPDCAQCEGALTSVVAGDDGFFAFGGIGRAGVARSEPIVYHSADGVSWQRQYIAGLNRGLITGVIATRFGPIAFGSAEAADQTQVPVVVTLNR
jgi:hypothetical protein